MCKSVLNTLYSVHECLIDSLSVLVQLGRGAHMDPCIPPPELARRGGARWRGGDCARRPDAMEPLGKGDCKCMRRDDTVFDSI